MLRVLMEDADYPYLMDNARGRLAQARSTARNAHLDHIPLVRLGGDTWGLFPWLGSYAFLALERFLKIKCADQLQLKGLDSSRPYFMEFRMKGDEQLFYDVLAEQATTPFDPLDLVYPDEVPIWEKYDEYVPIELIRKASPRASSTSRACSGACASGAACQMRSRCSYRSPNASSIYSPTTCTQTLR